MAGVVVSLLLPSGAINGGAAMKLRLGEQAIRSTTDLDFAGRAALEESKQQFAASLALAWNWSPGHLA